MIRMRRPIFAPVAVLSVLAGVLAFAGVPARAAGARSEIGAFGTQGPGMGSFEEPQSIAVEQSTGDVYVYDLGEGGRVYKFNAEGRPEDFSSTSTNVIEGVGGEAGEAEIAVDSSSGLAKGDIYIANGQEVGIYSSTGAKLSVLTEGEEPCGVAVGPSGVVYVAFSGAEAIRKYVPAKNPVSKTEYTSSLWKVGEVCRIAADDAGDVYAVKRAGGVTKYEASQFNDLEAPAVGAEIDSNGATLAVDPAPSGDLYINEKSEIAVYTSSGTRVESFGSLSQSLGVAVSEKNGDVYAPAARLESEVIIFGSASVAGDDTLTITKTGTGSGTVECEAGGSGHFETCAAEYGEGTAITLEGTAGSGSTFEGWSGGTGSASSCAGDGLCTFTINATTKVTATFNATSGGGKGEKGERGPKGEAGINGTNGGRGPQGPAGEAGPAGTQGEKGSAGANGKDGAQGPAGARGPAGPAGKVELVRCETVKQKGKSAQRCTTKLVSGAVKLTAAGAFAHALLSRHGAVYATGTARSAHGLTSLRLTPLRKLRPGHYTLTLIGGAGRYETMRREVFTLR